MGFIVLISLPKGDNLLTFSTFILFLIPVIMLLLMETKYFGKIKSISNEGNNKQIKNQTITEIKCTCLECGKIWHYLEHEELSMNLQKYGNLMVSCGSCCSPFAGYYANKASDVTRQMGDKFDKCPSCQSSNIKKEKHTIERTENV